VNVAGISTASAAVATVRPPAQTSGTDSAGALVGSGSNSGSGSVGGDGGGGGGTVAAAADVVALRQQVDRIEQKLDAKLDELTRAIATLQRH
jgi:hypothetical protein